MASPQELEERINKLAGELVAKGFCSNEQAMRALSIAWGFDELLSTDQFYFQTIVTKMKAILADARPVPPTTTTHTESQPAARPTPSKPQPAIAPGKSPTTPKLHTAAAAAPRSPAPPSPASRSPTAATFPARTAPASEASTPKKKPPVPAEQSADPENEEELKSTAKTVDHDELREAGWFEFPSVNTEAEKAAFLSGAPRVKDAWEAAKVHLKSQIKRGVTQNAVAAFLEVDVRTLNKYETYLSAPKDNVKLNKDAVLMKVFQRLKLLSESPKVQEIFVRHANRPKEKSASTGTKRKRREQPAPTTSPSDTDENEGKEGAKDDARSPHPTPMSTVKTAEDNGFAPGSDESSDDDEDEDEEARATKRAPTGNPGLAQTGEYMKTLGTKHAPVTIDNSASQTQMT